MRKHQVTNGVYYLDASEAGFRILCGCPMDSVKSLMRAGLIQIIDDEKWEWHSGPNTILLSDISFQNGELCNLTEFPLMHMLYKQGMAIPEHPGYGPKPMIVGIPEQIRGQFEYLERSVGGLTTQEIHNCLGMEQDAKDTLVAFKQRFKAGQPFIHDLITFKEILTNEEPYELAPDFFVVRLGLNVYLFQYKDQEEIIDLTLTENQTYGVPYNLDFHPTTRRDFSVIHSGEGNGWDIDHPCMASILCASGQYYLIDAGPNILESLNKLGIGLSEVVGLFQTHTHDDHFAGLVSILRSEHRLKFYATPVVRLSVVKKLCSLMNFDESNFVRFFEVCDLVPEKWSQLDGFEVLPIMSPHPVETNIFYFRKRTRDGYRSYGHLADVISKRVYKSFMAIEDEYQPILKNNFEHVWKTYYLPVNVKKIDVNSGLIHGDPEDYINDPSGKVIFSHITGSLSINQQAMGSIAVFGSEDLLINSSKDYLSILAEKFFQEYFPGSAISNHETILNQRRILINAGHIIVRNGSTPEYIYFILSGIIRWISPDSSTVKTMGTGSIISEEEVLLNQNSYGTYIANSYTKAIRIPKKIFREFIDENTDIQEYTLKLKERRLLQENLLFRNINTRSILDSVLESARFEEYKENMILNNFEKDSISLIVRGMAGIFYSSTLVETLSEGSFYGLDDFLHVAFEETMTVTALSDILIMHIPMQIFLETPVLLWVLIETADNTSKLISQTIRVLETTNQNMALTLEEDDI